MNKIIQEIEKEYLKKKLPILRSGDTVKVNQKILEGDKERTQIFEGLIIKRRGGNGLSGTFTVRKIAAGGIGVERTFSLHSPLITKITILKKGHVKQAQLYYIREKYLKSFKLKEKKEYKGITEWEENELGNKEIVKKDLKKEDNDSKILEEENKKKDKDKDKDKDKKESANNKKENLEKVKNIKENKKE